MTQTYPFSRANGSDFANGDVLTAAHATTMDKNAAQAADGLMWTDSVIAKNWTHKTTLTNARVVLHGVDASGSAQTRWLVVGASDMSTTSFSGAEWITPGTTAALCAFPRCGVVNGLTVLIGGDPNGSSANKIARSTTGTAGAFSAVSSVDTGTAAVDCLTFFASLYVAGLSDGGIETSPDGSTWTDRTVPNANARKEFATNGTILLAFSSATTDKYITSADGISWTERSFPVSATGYRGCWSSGQGKFYAIQQASSPTLYSSTDGISWNTVGNDGGIGSTCILRSYGRVLLALTGTVMLVSVDGGVTWKRVAYTTASSGWHPSSTDSVLYADGRIVAIDADAQVWSTLRFT